MNEYINIDDNNIANEHLCCAIGDPKHKIGVEAKKKLIKSQLGEGHVFRKLNVQGKVFIEYAPLETAWASVEGTNYMYIYCLWVAGSFKGKGYAKELLEYAIADAKKKGMNGLCTISSKKKKPFISEKGFFEHYGFKVVDTIYDYELLSLSFNGSNPKFTDTAKKMTINNSDLTIYYSEECPYTTNCIVEINEYAKDNKLPVNIIKIDSAKKAKEVPCVYNNWAVFKDGKFVSNTLLNKNSLDKLLK